MRLGVRDDLGDDVAQRLGLRVFWATVPEQDGAPGADRPQERAQLGIVAYQPFRVVQHRIESADDVVGPRSDTGCLGHVGCPG